MDQYNIVNDTVEPNWWNVSNSTHMHGMQRGRMPAQEGLRQAVLVSYLLTFLVGICGNCLVIYIIAYYKTVRTKSVANYYIWNLSLADLCFILTLPFFCYSTYTSDWPFGWFVCKLSYAIRETNRYASVFTLVALSVDRYLASFYNLGHFRTIRVGKLVCFVIWVMCLALSIPYWLYAHTFPAGGSSNKTICKFSWPRTHQQQYVIMWTYWQLCVGLLVPTLLIFGSYLMLARRLRQLLSSSCQRSVRASVQKPSRRMTRTVLVVVFTFLLCQTPKQAVELLSMQKMLRAQAMMAAGTPVLVHPDEYRVFVTLNALATILVFVSSCCNPIIYGLLNDNYSKYKDTESSLVKEVLYVSLCNVEHTILLSKDDEISSRYGNIIIILTVHAHYMRGHP